MIFYHFAATIVIFYGTVRLIELTTAQIPKEMGTFKILNQKVCR